MHLQQRNRHFAGFLLCLQREKYFAIIHTRDYIKHTMKTLIQGITFVLFVIFVNWQSLDASPLFDDQEILNAVLTAPLTQAYREKKQQKRLWHQGQWAYTDKDGSTQRLDIAIRTRGISRRRNCSLPPLQLNFKKKQTKSTLFDGQDKVKLVSPCKNRNREQQELILEYLAYKSLEVLTDKAFKTRLLRLSYVDSEKRKKPWTHLTFVIESEKNLAKRLNFDMVHVPKINSSELDPDHSALIELFQLMIANNDYSMIRGPANKNCCHNMELLKPKNTDLGIYPIPYDFDSNGLVNPEYAAPPEKLPIKDVRQRYFRGRCKPVEYWHKNISHIKSRQNEIMSIFQNSTELNSRYKSKTIRYLQKYFDILNDPKRIERDIIGRCLGKK